MVDDWTDPMDPANPLHPYFWSDWDCPECTSDGAAADLVNARCPNCGARVEPIL